MPLDKMPDVEKFLPTHKSTILHSKGSPIACIIDKNPENMLRYNSMIDDPTLKVSLIGFLNKHEDLGLFMGFKLQIQTNNDFFEFTVYPNDEFIETVIFEEFICIINEQYDNLFSLKIMTNQFVKTRSEFIKFQKMMK